MWLSDVFGLFNCDLSERCVFVRIAHADLCTNCLEFATAVDDVNHAMAIYLHHFYAL